MDYVESVTNSSSHKAARKQPIPAEIVSHALNLRTSPLIEEAFNNQENKLTLHRLSTEQRYLAQIRVAGSIATRFAMSSFYTPDVIPFIDLPETQKSDLIHSLIDNYATAFAGKKDEKPSSLFLDNSIDPMASVTHEDARNWVYATRTASMSIADHLELIRSYANLIPGSFPKVPHTIAPIAHNDAIFTQAFGRDDVTDKELVLIKDERIRLNDDTLMMEYLGSINFRPGPSNDALSESIHRILTDAQPNEQMVQWEVAFSLWKNRPDTYDKFKDYLHILWPSRDFYPTFEVKRDSIKVMSEIGVYNPAELAHGDMMIRALGIIAKQGVIADPIETAVPFDPGSTQPHVRSARSWVVREFLTRGEHILRGRVKF
jgi:hypothetical protein